MTLEPPEHFVNQRKRQLMEFITLQFGSGLSIGQPARRFPISRPAGASSSSRLPAQTDFSALTGKRVLIVADEANLRISVEEHGRRLSFELLHRKLSAAARSLSPWAVISASEGDTNRAAYLLQHHWQVISIPRETVMTVDGPRMKANADMDICFLAGNLIVNDFFHAIVVASGDGDLCIAIARGIRRVQPGQEIFTASVPGSTSHRILAANNSLFDGNVLLGRDVMRPAEPRSSTASKSVRMNDPLVQGENQRARFDTAASEDCCNASLRVGKH